MRALAVGLFAVSAFACDSRAPSSSAGPSASAVSRPLPSASAPPPPRATRPAKGCRVLTVNGGVSHAGGAGLSTGQTLDGSDWLDLADSAKLSLRHLASAREWTLLGPARVRPCLEGEEQLAVASGRVKTSVGAGARPGAEVFVFTPFGTVRYGDATLTVAVEPARLSLALDAGDAWFEPTGKTTAPRPETRKLGRSEVVSSKPNRALLEQRCAEDAQAAAAIAQGMTLSAPNGKQDLSKKAVSHLKARRAARLSCGEALAFAGRLEGEDRDRLIDRLAELDRTWRAFPKPSAPEHP